MPGDDIDTDRIVPARYLKEVTFANMGKYVFHDQRFDADGNKKEHPFNDSRFAGAAMLLVGRNFGCGSSREHAAQAIMRFGIKAIIGESFSPIFAGNCTMIGVPAVQVGHKEIGFLMECAQEKPGSEARISIPGREIGCGGRKISFSMPDAAANALASGTWDSTSTLMQNMPQAEALAKKLPYLNNFPQEICSHWNE